MKLTINVIMMLLLFVCSATISAQTNEKGYMVAGTVMDEKGETIIGASITVDKDRSKGTATDLDGKFRLQGLFKGEVLTVTFIGYKPYSYKVTMSKENIKIVLEPQVSDLDEVVIVGEGSQKKISLTGAVTTIEPAALDVPATSVSNMLGGNVPGIIAVTRSGEPGSDFSEFWVRGIGTFGANSSALILIDGVEGDMNQLDPADIESFSVLKDASATAIYGARGANGVVVVKTKQGKAGKLRINYKSSRRPATASAIISRQRSDSATASAVNSSFKDSVQTSLSTTQRKVAQYPTEGPSALLSKRSIQFTNLLYNASANRSPMRNVRVSTR